MLKNQKIFGTTKMVHAQEQVLGHTKDVPTFFSVLVERSK